jgi:hypothetical protein
MHIYRGTVICQAHTKHDHDGEKSRGLSTQAVGTHKYADAVEVKRRFDTHAALVV